MVMDDVVKISPLLLLDSRQPPMPLSIIGYGACSSFGGPYDTGVGPEETLAFYPKARAQDLDPNDLSKAYCALPHPIFQGPLSSLCLDEVVMFWRTMRFVVGDPDKGWVNCRQVDRGPDMLIHDTRRVMDLQPAILKHLGVDTDACLWIGFAPKGLALGPVHGTVLYTLEPQLWIGGDVK